MICPRCQRDHADVERLSLMGRPRPRVLVPCEEAELDLITEAAWR